MTIEDMEKFSINELETFCISELEQTPEQLIKSISRNESSISYQSYIKLCKLCEDINEKSKEKVNKPSMGVKDVLDCIYKLLWIALHTKDLQNVIIDGLQSLFH